VTVFGGIAVESCDQCSCS